MANVNQISVLIKTGSRGIAAGTHGGVYLGIGCKEFFLTGFMDRVFRPGLVETIMLSELSEAIVFDRRLNIGISPYDSDACYPYQIITDDLPKCPLYIRFEPGSENDYWDLDELIVIVDTDSKHVVLSALGEKSYLWSGIRGSKVMFLGESETTH